MKKLPLFIVIAFLSCVPSSQAFTSGDTYVDPVTSVTYKVGGCYANADPFKVDKMMSIAYGAMFPCASGTFVNSGALDKLVVFTVSDGVEDPFNPDGCLYTPNQYCDIKPPADPPAIIGGLVTGALSAFSVSLALLLGS